MDLSTVEDPDSAGAEGSYRVRPPARRRRVDPEALRAATEAAAGHGILDGSVLALAVSLCGLAMKILGGDPALVILLFVVSWSLLALHAPDEDPIVRALQAVSRTALEPADDRVPRRYVLLFLAAAMVPSLCLWHESKTQSDWAEGLTARGSTTLATIDHRDITVETDWTDQSGYPNTTYYYVVAYHLTVAGARYPGGTGESRCYRETSIGGTASVIYDPADPTQNLLRCSQQELKSRFGERIMLLLASMGVSLLILVGARSIAGR